MSAFENLSFKDNFDDAWIDDIIDLHNKTELKRSPDKKDAFIRAFKSRYAVISCWSVDQIVGFGSMISDGEMYSAIFDVVVDPEFQGKGIGREIVERLIGKAPRTCIHLTSTFGKEDFYRKMGFRKHKTAFAKYPFESSYLE